MAIINPEIVETDGEWVYDEGCLSIPGLYVEMLRPNAGAGARPRPRRQRDRDRGRRADGAAVPARARPPQRRADVRPHEARPAQGSAGRVPPPRRRRRHNRRRANRCAADSGCADRRPMQPRRTSARRRWRCRRCVRWSPPASTSPLVVHPRRQAPRPRGRAAPEPGEGGGGRARASGVSTASTTSSSSRRGAELGVVVAFGQIIKPHVLAVLPMVNLHFSLLPRWRGAAPVERALLAGDDVTGVCLMQLEEGLDTGRHLRRPHRADRRHDDRRRAAGDAGRRRRGAARRDARAATGRRGSASAGRSRAT